MGFCLYFCAALPVVFFLLFGPWGHGTWGNPINVTNEPLDFGESNDGSEYGKWFAEQYINGEMKLQQVKLEDAPTIDTFDEAQRAHLYAGWGKDETVGIQLYRMSPKMRELFCPNWEDATNLIYSGDDFRVTRNLFHHGSYPVGCGSSNDRFINITAGERLEEGDALYFNSEIFPPDKLEEMVGDSSMSPFISAFYSDWSWASLNSPFHNAMVTSIAVQCHGKKMWTFAPPRAQAKYGLRSYNGATICRGMDEDDQYYVTTTGPGTIITFPPWWPHFVITMPGRQFMYTLRQVSFGWLKYFLPTERAIQVEVLIRLWSERLSLLWTLPPNNGKSAYENSRPLIDVHSDPRCRNGITKETLDAIIARNNEVLKS